MGYEFNKNNESPRKSAPRILYLTYDGLTDPLGQSQVLPYMIGLSERGYAITIISSEKPNRWEQIDQLKELTTACGIRWIHIPYTKSPPILSTLYDLWKIRRISKRLCLQEKFEIVHCRSYITSLVGLWLKRRFKLRFIFDMRGFYADERIDGGMWNQRKLIYKWIYRFFKNRESAFLEEADSTICLTQDAFKEIRTWRKIDHQPIPIQVIPCCVDPQLFHPEQDIVAQASAREILGLAGNELVLSYVGAVGTWYLLDEMLDFFKRMLIVYPNARFLFISHEDAAMIRSKAKAREIPDSSILIHQVPHHQVPVYLSLSHVSIFFIKPVYSKKASSPVKLGEIMSMGIPIICNSNVGDTDRIIRESGAGAIVRSFSNDDYDFVIHDLPRLLQLPKQGIRQAAVQLFSLSKGVDQYHQVYQKLIEH